MKKLLSSAAIAIAVLGTTLWAQQEEPQPAKASANPSSPAAADPRPSTRPGIAPPSRSDGTRVQETIPDYRSPASGQQTMQDVTPLNSYGAPTPYYSLPTQAYNPGYSQPYPTAFPAVAYPSTLAAIHSSNPEEIEGARAFGETLQALRSAKTDEERTELRKKMNEQVSAEIDRDLAAREKQLGVLEAKLKDLREQLQHRRESKAEIQKTIVMLAENPQSGLLPPAWMNVITIPGYQPITPAGSYMQRK